jgi:hypothetical protein
MKIISIIKNDVTNSDLAIYLKDNYSHDINESPGQPRNTTHVTQTKSGVLVLQVEFWRNSRFQKYFVFGESLSVSIDEDTDFNKRGRPWVEFKEVYESF